MHWLRVCLYNWTGFGQCHRGFYWAPPNVTSVTWTANSVNEMTKFINLRPFISTAYRQVSTLNIKVKSTFQNNFNKIKFHTLFSLKSETIKMI